MALEDSKLKKMVISFLVGLVYFGIFVLAWFLAWFIQNITFQIIVIGLGFIGMLFLASESWGWLRSQGTNGVKLKAFIIVALIGTVIGLIPVAYWTGKRILQMLGYIERI